MAPQDDDLTPTEARIAAFIWRLEEFGSRYVLSREDDERGAAEDTLGPTWWAEDGQRQYEAHMRCYAEGVALYEGEPEARNCGMGVTWFRFWYWVAMRKRYAALPAAPPKQHRGGRS